MKTCRFCLQEVADRSRRCPHCQADISLFGRLKPVVSILIAAGGFGFGFYEQHVAKGSKEELKQEQKALATVLESVPDENVPEEYKCDQSEEQLEAELKKNPRNLRARIGLRFKQARRHRHKHSTPNAEKTDPPREVRDAGKTPERTASRGWRGPIHRR